LVYIDCIDRIKNEKIIINGNTITNQMLFYSNINMDVIQTICKWCNNYAYNYCQYNISDTSTSKKCYVHPICNNDWDGIFISQVAYLYII